MTDTIKNPVDRSSMFGQPNVAPTTPLDVRLNIGPYRSGKTIAVIDDLLEYCRTHPFSQSLVVVPSQRYRLLLEQRVEERLEAKFPGAKTGFVGLQILPFYRACEFVLKKCGYVYKLIPEQVRAALIAKVLADLKESGSLQTLEPIIGFAGTHSALLELIDEVQRAAFLPDQVIDKLQETAGSDAKYIELSRIYQNYSSTLSQLGYVDERGLAFQARALLSQPEQTLSLGIVVADGFDRFNHLQLHVLEGLAKRSAQTRICFDYVPPEEDTQSEYSWKETSFNELRAVFRSASQVQHADIAEHPTVHRYRCLDRFFEAAEVARSIKQKLIDGAEPSDFLVVARNVATYAEPIHAAFQDAGISYFLDEAIQLASLPSTQLLIRLVELSAVRKFKRKEVISTLRAPHFRQSAIFENDRELNKLDRLSISDKIVESAEQWLHLLRARSSEFSKSTLIALEKFFTDLEPKQFATLREHVVWVEDLIDRYFEFATEQGEDPFVRWEESRALAEFRRSLASLIQEENICGTASVSSDFFLARLKTLIERANFRRLPRHRSTVTVCGADLAPNKMFAEIFVLGVAEGEFPRKAKQTGFLSVDEVGGWLSFGIDLRNPRYHPAFEPALFKSLVNRARATVHLYCPNFDLSGEELLPSYLMSEGADPAELRNIAAHATALTAPTSPREAVSSILWKHPEADLQGLRAMLPLTTVVETLFEPTLVNTCRKTTTESNYCGDLREFVRTGSLKHSAPAIWSATKLNDYGKCPFKYWMTHVIGVQPVTEPEARIDAMVLGETYHKALELFYTTLTGRDLTLTTVEFEEATRIFNTAVNAALALLQQRPDVRHGEFWRYERNEIAFRLNRFFAKEWERARNDQDQYVPAMMEAGFGLPDALSRPLLKIRDGNEKISVRGRIDRIDIARDSMGSHEPRVRIIDYKAGSSPISKDDAIKGRNIQLSLYALAVERCIMPGSRVHSGIYLSVSSGEPSGRLAFVPEAKERSSDTADYKALAEQHVRDFVRGVAAGDFRVSPNHRSVCLRCEHQAVCRIADLPESSQAEGQP